MSESDDTKFNYWSERKREYEAKKEIAKVSPKDATSSGKTEKGVSPSTVQGIGAVTAATGNITGEILKNRNEELKRQIQQEAQLRNAQLRGRLAGVDTLSKGTASANNQLLGNLPSVGRR